MYRLLIVDDEKVVIEGLTTATDWNEHQIEIVGFAMDGEEALEKIIELKPTIVLADIRIPKMNGLDLIKEAKRLNLEVFFIIISGYSEFSYAKRAIELETIDYLVKPIEVDEIICSIKKAICKYEKLREEKQIDDRLKQYKNELEEKHVLDFILGHKTDQSNFYQKVKQFCFVEICMNSLEWGEEIDEEKVHSLINRIKNLLKARGFDCFIYTIDRLIVIMLSISGQKVSDALFKDVIALIFHELKTKAVLGISHIYENTSKINKAYIEAKEALKIGAYTNQLITYYKELENINNTIGTTLIQEIEEFFSVQKVDVLDKIHAFNDYVIDYAKKNRLSPQKTRYLCFKLVNHLFDYIESEYEVKNVGGERHLLYEELNSLNSLNETKKWLDLLINKTTGFLNENKMSYNDKLIMELKGYLKTHYKEPIVLDDLGRHFHKSPAYLCSLFSKAVGKTIFEYITIVRMDNAKKLLRTTNYKVSEICLQVGYENQKYFNQVFKKNIGTTPGTYRAQHLIK